MKLFAVIVLALALVAAATAQQQDEVPKSELADALRKTLENTVEKIKERVNVKHQKATELLEKAQELAERLRQLKSDAGDKIRDLVANNKGKLQELFEKLREKVQANRDQQDREKRAVDLDQVKEALKDLKANTKERFTEFAKWVREQVSAKLQAAKDKKDRLLTIAREVRDHAKEMRKGAVREAIEALRPFRDQLGENWQQALEAAKNVLRPTTPAPQEESREKRAVDLDQVKEALTDLKANTKDRFTEFAKWVREQVAAKLQAARDAKDRYMTIAREVRDHAREMKQGAIREAIEALRPHREELGNTWREALEAARNALRRPTAAPQA